MDLRSWNPLKSWNDESTAVGFQHFQAEINSPVITCRRDSVESCEFSLLTGVCSWKASFEFSNEMMMWLSWKGHDNFGVGKHVLKKWLVTKDVTSPCLGHFQEFKLVETCLHPFTTHPPCCNANERQNGVPMVGTNVWRNILGTTIHIMVIAHLLSLTQTHSLEKPIIAHQCLQVTREGLWCWGTEPNKNKMTS